MNTEDLVDMPVRDFGRLLLLYPGIVYSFLLNHEWYDIICARFLEPQIVMICPCFSSVSSALFILSSYVPNPYWEEIGAQQSAECEQEMIDGLNRFNSSGIWQVKLHDRGQLFVQYQKIN